MRRTLGVYMAAMSALAFPAVGSSQDFSVLYHERLANLSIDETAVAAAAAAGTAAKPQPAKPALSFVAFGRRFDLALERNDGLMRALPTRQLGALRGVHLYRGRLAGVNGSWVRLTRYGGTLSGLIWDGSQLYAVERLGDVAPFLVTPDSADPTTSIIYRWNDTIGTLTDLYGFVPAARSNPAASDGADAASKSAAISGSTADAALAATTTLALPVLLSPARQLDVGFVADYEFVSADPTQAEPRLMAIANNVDGIMLNGPGIHINVAELQEFDTDTEPFDTSDPPGLLAELEVDKDVTPALHDQGLAHLFTGRDLSNADAHDVVGVANLGAVCDARHGVGLTQATFGAATDSLIAAHEIGHNLGAPHDGEAGSACADTPQTYLMAPVINGSRTFSECSLEQIQAVIAAATCFKDVAPDDLSLRRVSEPPASVLLGDGFSFGASIDAGTGEDGLEITLTFSATGARVTDIVADAGLVGGFYCDYAGAWPVCTMDRLPAGQSFPFTVRATATQLGTVNLDVAVASVNDPDGTNNAQAFETEALPAVDLAVPSATAAPDVVRPGEELQVALDLENQGLMTATGVTAQLYVPTTLFEVAGATLAGGGACAASVDPSLVSCAVGSLAPQAVQRLDLTLRAVDPGLDAGAEDLGFVRARLSADQPDVGGFLDRFVEVGVAPVIAHSTITLSGPTAATTGSTVKFTLLVENDGPDSIPSSELDFDNLGMQIVGVNDGGVGVCDTRPERSQVACSLGALGAGQTYTVIVAGTASMAGEFAATSTLYPSAYDPSPSNRTPWLSFTVSASPPPPPATSPPASVPSGGSGGGGAAAPESVLWLLLLTLVRVSATRPRRRPSAPARCNG